MSSLADLGKDFSHGLYEKEIDLFDFKHISSLLLYTGYLTIENVCFNERGGKEYKLSFPNHDIRYPFLRDILSEYANISMADISGHIDTIETCLKDENYKLLIKELNIFYANIPYDVQLNYEKYYQGIFYVVLKLLGISIDVEIHTNEGSIDAVIHLEDKIYLIEFKLGKSSDEALAQIHEKHYAEKYQNQNKKIILLGINFDREKRKISDWKVGE